ncbi:DUF2780 domain-containing protein [Parendozoicomonas sp. Alg238-R29]|uniref:DUF2780 domain-containing protein n=1 Tax=Parendozoicomonas sp. Alg238-R29 TaxID=2993446 RepID=UPI00248DA849|nr:DUF2780 domain-containing protein [Parendozoicomonas sp. Alg238-R29]
MKKTLVALALTSVVATSVVATSAQASFWDSWFSEPTKESIPAAGSTPEVQEVVKTTATSTIQDIAAGLIPALTQQLGVSETQASGGMGALFQLAKGNLTGDDFSQLSQSIPDMTTLLNAAPKLDPNSVESQLGGWLAKAGSAGETLNDLAQLKSQFDTLGLDAAMISKFATTAINYLQSDEGKQTAALLQKGLGALLAGES